MSTNAASVIILRKRGIPTRIPATTCPNTRGYFKCDAISAATKEISNVNVMARRGETMKTRE
jgi:hypothetical protein